MSLPDRGALLFVGSMLPQSVGVKSQDQEVARRLASAGWRVLTVSHRLSRLGRVVDILLSIWKWRRRYDAACISVFSGLAFRWAEAACIVLRVLGKPYILALHGGNLPAFARASPKRARRLFESAFAVTAPSHYLLETMRPYRNDLLLIPNALETRSFSFRPRETPAPRLIWVRAFHEIYNPTLAPRVVAALAPTCPSVHLTMVGRDKDGSLSRVRRVASELGVADRVELPGPVPNAEIGAWLDRDDVFLNTTNVDNTPISVLEAQAAGLCVVSTNVGGLPYLLADGKDALLVPPDDPAAMAEAVRRLFTEPGLAASLSRNGRAKAERFDWSCVLPQWEGLFEKVGFGRASGAVEEGGR
ncbi:MAG TPA: glycosyltransferase family 4 protein [Thermoanaerobaculia bacterium]